MSIKSTSPLRDGGTFLSQAPPLQDTEVQEGSSKPRHLTNGIISVTMFSLSSLKRMSCCDFVLESKEKIAIRWKDCMIVYFYIENTESQQLNWIIALVSQQVAGPIIGTCNLFLETEVATAFAELRMHGSHPLHWAAVKGVPFILAYRMGFPVAFYNGELTVQAIADWATSLACKADYYEHLNLSVGIQAEAPYQIGDFNFYSRSEQSPQNQAMSRMFQTQRPVRGYNPRYPVALQGSELAEEEARLQELEQQQKKQKENQPPKEEESTTAAEDQEPTEPIEATEEEPTEPVPSEEQEPTEPIEATEPSAPSEEEEPTPEPTEEESPEAVATEQQETEQESTVEQESEIPTPVEANTEATTSESQESKPSSSSTSKSLKKSLTEPTK